jgi:propanol-preferring alcohol dehydrogenase
MAAPEIPKTQKAAVYDQPGTVSTKIVDIEVPEPGAGEVLINLFVDLDQTSDQRLTSHRTHSGVCHSDYGVMTNTV